MNTTTATATLETSTAWASCPVWCDRIKCSGIKRDEDETWIHHLREFSPEGFESVAVEISQYAYVDGERSVTLVQHDHKLTSANLLSYYRACEEARLLLVADGYPYAVEMWGKTPRPRQSVEQEQKAVGALWRIMREARGLSVEVTAGLAVMSPAEWEAVEAGRRDLVGDDRMRVIGLLLGIN